jgi:hypothetical protein
MVTQAEIEAAATIVCSDLCGDCCVMVHDEERTRCTPDNCRVWPIVQHALEAAERVRAQEQQRVLDNPPSTGKTDDH